MATTDRIIACRTDPKVLLKNGLGHTMLNIAFETDSPPASPPHVPLVARLAMPFDTHGDVTMDKTDPRLPVDFRFSNVMSLQASNRTMSCMLLVEIPSELKSVPIKVTVSENDGTVITQDTSKNGQNMSLLFDVTVRG